uniref:Coiled-coil domain containing 7 n=2 Tax=Jaculus jaculus TaxID=51337 RepID=A0A8C5P5W5_JACJA
QSAKHLAAITKKLSNVPDLPHKKGQLMSPLSPKQKEKLGAKSVPDKIEPMVLRSPPTGESVMRYALPIPSSKTKESLAGEMVRRITKHLQTAVASLEDAYGPVTEGGEVGVTTEEQDLS